MKLQVCRCALVFLKRAALFSFRIPDCRLRKACNNRLSQYKSAQCTLTWTWREARRDFTQRVKQDSLIRKRQMFFLSWRAIALSFVLSPTPLNRWPSHSLEIKSWICSYLETLGWLSCTNNGEWDDWYDRDDSPRDDVSPVTPPKVRLLSPKCTSTLSCNRCCSSYVTVRFSHRACSLCCLFAMQSSLAIPAKLARQSVTLEAGLDLSIKRRAKGLAWFHRSEDPMIPCRLQLKYRWMRHVKWPNGRAQTDAVRPLLWCYRSQIQKCVGISKFHHCMVPTNRHLVVPVFKVSSRMFLS